MNGILDYEASLGVAIIGPPVSCGSGAPGYYSQIPISLIEANKVLRI